MRLPLNEIRRQVVKRVFRKVDEYGEGVVDIDYLIECYDLDRHPGVVSGDKSK